MVGPTPHHPQATMTSSYNDEELHDWLRWTLKNGSSFLKDTAEAAMLADVQNYNLLRPVLLELKKMNPRTSLAVFSAEYLCRIQILGRPPSPTSRQVSTSVEH